ncbi:Uu.00g063620.m01.CDS01 [Anthostomella pinea]|uniref:Uu.00g063620.m01.CDS01 n=1 Tax=Anthostomella pinea TaxID=933095 RepID=A0AAI8VTD0_9PEZI|nr:Uu.00g063620.m01.CDS01 [Anthostomella pinea]
MSDYIGAPFDFDAFMASNQHHDFQGPDQGAFSGSNPEGLCDPSYLDALSAPNQHDGFQGPDQGASWGANQEDLSDPNYLASEMNWLSDMPVIGQEFNFNYNAGLPLPDANDAAPLEP